MAFSINLYNVDRVKSYADAVRFHAKAAEKPWRNGGEDLPFPTLRKRHFGVRREDSGDIIFRYHRTDVVRWRPDNSVCVEVYPSISTCLFIERFTPVYWFKQHKNGYVAMQDSDKDWLAVPVMSNFDIDPEGNIDPYLPVVFSIDRVKRDVAKRLREESGYKDFAAWRKVVAPLLDMSNMGWKERRYAEHASRQRILENGTTSFNMDLACVAALKKEELWPDLVRVRVSNASLLKECVYYAHRDEVYEQEHFPTLRWKEPDGKGNLIWKNLSRYDIVGAPGMPRA